MIAGGKKWYASRGVLGGLVSVLAGVAGLFGYDIDAELQEKLIDLAVSMATLCGGAVAIVGRIAATKAIARD